MATQLYNKVIAVEFNRPTDSPSPIAYTAKDAIANSTGSPTLLTFSGITPDVSQFGYITKVRLMTNNSAWASTNAAVIKLHLYKNQPTAIADNAPFTILYANRANRIGTITFPALSTEGSGSDSATALWTGALAFESRPSNNTIYGMLEVDSFSGTLTPTNAQSFFIEITTDCI